MRWLWKMRTWHINDRKLKCMANRCLSYLHTIELVRGDLQVGELHLFVGRRFVLSICHGTTLNAAQVRQRCEEGPQPLAHGPSVLLYTIMDMIVDLYQPMVHRCADAIEEVETRLFHQLLDRQDRAQLLVRG